MTRIEPHSTVMNYFAYQMAIIQVNNGENNEEAWQRHVMENPEDINATIRVFNI